MRSKLNSFNADFKRLVLAMFVLAVSIVISILLACYFIGIENGYILSQRSLIYDSSLFQLQASILKEYGLTLALCFLPTLAGVINLGHKFYLTWANF